MDLILYKTNDDENVINKTLTNEKRLNIVLKRDVDIVNPKLVLMRSNSYDIHEYNYLHIPFLKRYYFIKSVDSINNDLIRVSCECDVLETYKNDILNSEAIYKGEAKAGDYGVIDANSSSNRVEKLLSDVTLEKGRSLTISTIEVQ